ncbi:MAG: TIGR00266 family protein [Blastocatellia bacterium]|nr:TIGR00266 family protein [Blastocatellia bacterium]
MPQPPQLPQAPPYPPPPGGGYPPQPPPQFQGGPPPGGGYPPPPPPQFQGGPPPGGGYPPPPPPQFQGGPPPGGGYPSPPPPQFQGGPPPGGGYPPPPPPQFQGGPPPQQQFGGSGFGSGPNSIRCSIEPPGSFSLAIIQLAPEQSIKAEAGAMVSMSPNVEMLSQAQGGLMGVLKRAVVGESAIVNTFTARGGPGEITLAPSSPGDVIPLELNNQTFFVQSGSFLASSPTIELDLKFGGAKSFFSGEGLFLIKLFGSGTLLLTSFGAIRRKKLAPGERYVVDTGHIVAFESTIQYTVRKASQQGFFRNMVSGEGFVCEYVGPGEIFLQTRNLAAFAGILRPFFPSQGSGGGGFKVEF